jgi:hypothetical protein
MSRRLAVECRQSRPPSKGERTAGPVRSGCALQLVGLDSRRHFVPLTSEIEATQRIESKLDRIRVLARVLALRESQQEPVTDLEKPTGPIATCAMGSSVRIAGNGAPRALYGWPERIMDSFSNNRSWIDLNNGWIDLAIAASALQTCSLNSFVKMRSS